MKTIKAWAVVKSDGNPVVNIVGGFLLATSKERATEIYAMLEGYRVVRVTITVEDE